ncbi:MAG: hypothetical protein ACK40G_11340 [Cytophagaceae bacterium]
MKTVVIFFLTLFFYNANCQDFRNVNWGDSPDEVKRKESAGLLKETPNSAKGVENLTYVEFTQSDLYYTYTYVFHENKLIGVRIKTAFLNENSKFKAMNSYTEIYGAYQAKYENVKEEKKSNDEFKSFNVTLKDKKIYVGVKKENNEFFLTESIFKN